MGIKLAMNAIKHGQRVSPVALLSKVLKRNRYTLTMDISRLKAALVPKGVKYMGFEQDTPLSLKIKEFIKEFSPESEMVVSVHSPGLSTKSCTVVRASPEFLAFFVAHILAEVSELRGGLDDFFEDVKMVMTKIQDEGIH